MLNWTANAGKLISDILDLTQEIVHGFTFQRSGAQVCSKLASMSLCLSEVFVNFIRYLIQVNRTKSTRQDRLTKCELKPGK